MIKCNLVNFLLLFFVSTISIDAQESSERWGIGLNIGSVLYSLEDKSTVGGRIIVTIPGISISKYLGNKLTISATFSNSINDLQQYFSSDFNLSYDILNTESFIRPYILAGIGVVNLWDTGITLNIGGGGTLWLTNNIGFNGQLMYKVSTFGGEFQRSHIFASGGIIYTFNPSRNRRLWEK